jgi:hypothetical protein
MTFWEPLSARIGRIELVLKPDWEQDEPGELDRFPEKRSHRAAAW